MDALRSKVTVAIALLVLASAGATVALALAAAPALAFTDWAHNGAAGCVCHDNGTPTDATCATCHTGFASYPGKNCWTCHVPGQDTSSLSSPSSSCSQECHLYDPVTKTYSVAFTHGANPHVGSTSAPCLSCHSVSSSVTDAGASPHHSGSATGFTECSSCHAGYSNHAGKVSCTTCHNKATAFHTHQAKSPGFKSCASCHKVKHQGRKVPQSKCAACHKGTGSGGAALAQHSASISKGRVCSVCHHQKLHAKKLGSGISSCGTCHKGKYHAKQHLPGKTVCERCHTAAAHHSNGFTCTICHRKAVHSLRPNAFATR